ncbi:MAG: efflux RND transporter periplasmic adaptor subunit [Candidatus Falkowbacteria bacterium]
MKIKKIAIIIIILIIVGAVASYFVFGEKETVEYTTVKAERGSILQTVSETGVVKASNEVDLNFSTTGKIAKILVKIGDIVKNGQVLAELDYSDLSINEQEAQANLDIANAQLNKLLDGATKEEIAVSQASVDQAKASYDSSLNEFEKISNKEDEAVAQAEEELYDLEDASSNTITTYEQAVSVAEVALNNAKSVYQRAIDNKEDDLLVTIENKLTINTTALDTVNTILEDDDTDYVLSILNLAYLNNTKSDYSAGKNLLSIANASLNVAKLSGERDDIKKAVDDVLASLNKAFSCLNNCYGALDNSVVSTTFILAELNSYKSDVSADQNSINNAISAIQTDKQELDDAVLAYAEQVATEEEDLIHAQTNLNDAIIDARNSLYNARTARDQKIATAQTAINSAIEALEVAKAQLAQTKAQASIQDVLLSQAQVRQAQAALNSVKNKIENSIIKAPIEGVITEIGYEIGEQTSLSESVVSILVDNNFEIEVDISEADISKVKVNNPVEITLDAFGDDIKFLGKVNFIEPAETVIQDVIYYKVKIIFNEFINDSLNDVKSGMTANTIITTAQKENVLMIPSRAVVDKNGSGKIVRILVNSEINEAPVNLGLRGDEGMVEVLSGIKEGDLVVTSIKTKK